ncbi:ankyrin repeat and LEM domain-containing protein 2 homolog [Aricia agestis]|uniref:ankyrin repeat and LEM domain-containing protein 2 homolog n=1 Tax=Aricia agestis TaxID=91739 RepID=UPI001C2021C2|nr:ankyrin repeat and LEM domain-containing protein 2 homolog [Aricia agestis]XP_041969045.1 ankyrin repeat and LEM domain-containing protein 2 homolog [Aricia agestis]
MSKAVIIPDCNKDVGGIKDEISLSPSDKKNGAISLFSRLLRLDSLGKKPNSPDSPPSTEPPTTYYGVYIPCEIKKGPDEEALHVYENKSQALELVRRYKLARFKAFKNHQEAVSFALRGAETETWDGCGNGLGEKPYPFKAPSPQDMVALRKAIEKGCLALVRDRIWDNPRYLISSGNSPTILQEGARFNALHVAARAMNAEMCNLILTTVGDPSFVQLLYGADTDSEACKEFAGILVDRYLNTPDKVANETPLHFAAKFGAEQAVDVLTSFSQCNRNAQNRDGNTPKDVVCTRANNKEAAERICALLEERFYVPVLHSEDASSPPTIGQPFTPADPPELNTDPLSPRVEIRAFAGPMRAGDACTFRRRWRTPPRAARPFRLREMTKGLETVGRNLAEQMKIGWKEYWPFLDTFTDLRSTEGLTLLENYLKTKYENACSFVYNDSVNQSHSPEELSMSGISLNVTQEQGNEALSPMSELCVALKTCRITDRHTRVRKMEPAKPIPRPQRTNGDTTPPINHTVSQILCIDRTCQVFAKRIANALIFSLTAEPEVVGDSLKSECKNLQHTIYTYMNDERFQAIDFALIHSRLAQLVVYTLKQRTQEMDDIDNLVGFLLKLRCPNDDIFSSDDERKPFSCRNNRIRLTHVIDSHVRCLASFISEEITESESTKGPAISETDCAEIWNKTSKCRCDWKVDAFDRNSKKNASFRKSRLSSSPQSESFIRRLSYNEDIGDGRLQNKVAESCFSVNSPGGDGATAFTVDVTKCQVVEAEISDDESGSESEGSYVTADEHDAPDDRMSDASDQALAEPFIYGEEPTKIDRLVYEAVKDVSLTSEAYPNVFRWKHTVALYTDEERESWQPAKNTEDSRCSVRWGADDSVCQSPVSNLLSPHSPSVSMSPHSPRGRLRLRAIRCSTPTREAREDNSRDLPLQVSNWLRITGPNSPKSALATKHVEHNVSFGF